MKILGISPLDKDATVSIVEDGKILFAAGEEQSVLTLFVDKINDIKAKIKAFLTYGNETPLANSSVSFYVNDELKGLRTLPILKPPLSLKDRSFEVL